jgi:uncharacterized membrane protein YfcA
MGLPGVPDPTAAALLLIAAIAGGLVRGFTGFGFAMIFVPVASLAVGPVAAVAFIWFMDAPYAFPLAARSFRRASWREVAPLLAGSVAAMPLGVWLLTRIDRDVVRWIVAASIIAALGALMSGWRYRGQPGVRLSLSVGGLSGLYGGLAQLSGMPLAIFWLGSQTNDARLTRDNLQVYFAVMTIVSGVVFAAAGVLKIEQIWTAAPLALAYGIGLGIGVVSFGYATEQTFRRIAYAVIAVSVLVALPLFDPLFGR